MTMARINPALAALAMVAAGAGDVPRIQRTKRYYDPGKHPAPRAPVLSRPGTAVVAKETRQLRRAREREWAKLGAAGEAALAGQRQTR